jgi:hypothetical protein
MMADDPIQILAAVQKLVRTIRRCLPIDTAPDSGLAAPWPHYCYTDYCVQRQSRAATFSVLLKELPTPAEPDLVIRMVWSIARVERDLRAVWQLVQEDNSKRWRHLLLLLQQLQDSELYSWSWDGRSPLRTGSLGPHHSGHPCIIIVRLDLVPSTLLDDLLQAARAGAEEEQPEERVRFDKETHTVYLDEVPHKVEDPKAFAVYQAIVHACPHPLTKDQIRSKVRGCSGNNKIPSLLNNLPAPLSATVCSGPNGYWFDLDPATPSRRRPPARRETRKNHRRKEGRT